MASDVMGRLRDNSQMAVETARCIARFSSPSHFSASTRRQLREGVEKRLWEIAQLMDSLSFRERTPDTERMLRVARQTERLWHDVAKRLGANDDLTSAPRKVA